MPVRELESRTVYLPILGAIVNVLVLSIYCQTEASKFAARPPVNKYDVQAETGRYSAGVIARWPFVGEIPGDLCRNNTQPDDQGSRVMCELAKQNEGESTCRLDS